MACTGPSCTLLAGAASCVPVLRLEDLHIRPWPFCRSLPRHTGSNQDAPDDGVRVRSICSASGPTRTRGWCMLAGRFLADCRSLLAGSTRRDLLRGLAAGLGLGSAYTALESEAKKKRKRRKKKQKPATPNEFGCIEVGDRSQSADECCSGVCEGKKCRAHGVDVCRQDRPGVCTAGLDEAPSLGCGANCWCFRTTAGSNFCAPAPRTAPQLDCTTCRKDADCIALGYPAGSACAQVGRGNCSGWCDSGMACLVPCGVPFPEEM